MTFNKLISGEDKHKAYEVELYATEATRVVDRYIKTKNKYSFIKNNIERNVQSFLMNELNEYLQPLLIRADKMGMRNSIEIRLPYLDIKIVEFALNLPLKHKVKINKTKVIVKKLAENYIDKKNIYRRKEGFQMPFTEKCLVDHQLSNERNYVLYSKIVLDKFYNGNESFI